MSRTIGAVTFEQAPVRCVKFPAFFLIATAETQGHTDRAFQMRDLTTKEPAPRCWSATNAAELEERGFTYVSDICPASDLSVLRGTLPRLFSERAGSEEGMFYDM